ncbi:HEAT repeat domain-containing protein [Frankia sp. AiPs1]|uniref:HEAT repeat domain-containing protein n=1 Tax=Frankia sp. AiPs1 TaxID=573493 RepID=UPI00204321ED|nr:HEAT repeat domain-containing protein [Frankia sp. AiPs1]MCM3920740.1 HEAT repeat domain-containing protein [Frankia sp. AiPs1]
MILDVMAESHCLETSSDLLLEIMEVRHGDLASAAARLLVLRGADVEAAMVRLLPKVRGSYSRFRCLSTLLYGRERLGREELTTVSGLIAGGDRRMRLVGLTILALRGDASCTDRIIECLGGRDLATREAALKALVAVGDGRAVDAVLAQLEKDAARRSDPHSSVIDLALNYLAQHSAPRPDAFRLACAAVAANWGRRDAAELAWIRVFLRRFSPHDMRSVDIPSPRDLQSMRSQVVDRMKDGALPPASG